jgi:hypothetical protein
MKKNIKKHKTKTSLLIFSITISFILGMVFSSIFFKQTEIKYIYINQTQPKEILQPPVKEEEELPQNKTYDLIIEFTSDYPYTGRGETIKFYGSVKDNKSNPVGPVNVIIKIFSPGGTLIENTTLTSLINGTFEYMYRVPLTLRELGSYNVTAQAYFADRWSHIEYVLMRVRS